MSDELVHIHACVGDTTRPRESHYFLSHLRLDSGSTAQEPSPHVMATFPVSSNVIMRDKAMMTGKFYFPQHGQSIRHLPRMPAKDRESRSLVWTMPRIDLGCCRLCSHRMSVKVKRRPVIRLKWSVAPSRRNEKIRRP